jgi:hypothetical protein
MEKKDKAFKDMQVRRKQYGMIQVSTETHQLLKEYCAHHGFKMGGFIEAIIKQYIKGKR